MSVWAHWRSNRPEIENGLEPLVIKDVSPFRLTDGCGLLPLHAIPSGGFSDRRNRRETTGQRRSRGDFPCSRQPEAVRLPGLDRFRPEATQRAARIRHPTCDGLALDHAVSACLITER